MKKIICLTLLCLSTASCSKTNTDQIITGDIDNIGNNTTDITTDSVTTPSISDSSEEIRASLSTNGNWITCAKSDIILNEETIVEGTFYKKDDESQGLYRKLALYTQDDEKTVTNTFTLTTPSMTIYSENFLIQEGVVNGDIYINANGFELKNCTIEGDLIFENEGFKNSAKLDKGVITGEIQ